MPQRVSLPRLCVGLVPRGRQNNQEPKPRAAEGSEAWSQGLSNQSLLPAAVQGRLSPCWEAGTGPVRCLFACFHHLCRAHKVTGASTCSFHHIL